MNIVLRDNNRNVIACFNGTIDINSLEGCIVSSKSNDKIVLDLSYMDESYLNTILNVARVKENLKTTNRYGFFD